MITSVLFITVCFLANFKGVATLFGSGTANYRPTLSSRATLTTLALIPTLWAQRYTQMPKRHPRSHAPRLSLYTNLA